jgi:hypothetical protein
MELTELETSLPTWDPRITVDAELGKAAAQKAATDKIEREAALWAFGLGGTIAARSYSHDLQTGTSLSKCSDIKDPSSLPEAFRVAAVHLQDKEVGDDDLELLSKCKFLRQADLRGTNVTAQGVAELKKALPNCNVQR